MKQKHIMKSFINDLKCLVSDLKENGELEETFDIALLLGSQEELRKSGKKVIWTDCGNCNGFGKHKLYNDEWECKSCYGLGGKYREQ